STGREHVVVAAPPIRADLELVGCLHRALAAEDRDGAVVEADDALPAALGGPFHALTGYERRRASDDELLGIEVHIRPAEVEEFAATGAGIGGQVEEGPEAVIAGVMKERLELL